MASLCAVSAGLWLPCLPVLNCLSPHNVGQIRGDKFRKFGLIASISASHMARPMPFPNISCFFIEPAGPFVFHVFSIGRTMCLKVPICLYLRFGKVLQIYFAAQFSLLCD